MGNGDHNMLEINLVGALKNNDSLEEVPDWTKADLGQLKVALENVDWEKKFENMSGTQSMDKFYLILDREVERFVPKKMRRKGNKPLWNVDDRKHLENDKEKEKTMEKLLH